MKAAPPAQPLLRRVWRFVKHGVHASFFQRGSRRFRISAASIRAEFLAAIADKHKFYVLLELGHVGDVCDSDAAAAEDADAGKLIEVSERDCPRCMPPIARPAIARCG